MRKINPKSFRKKSKKELALSKMKIKIFSKTKILRKKIQKNLN